MSQFFFYSYISSLYFIFTFFPINCVQRMCSHNIIYGVRSNVKINLRLKSLPYRVFNLKSWFNCFNSLLLQFIVVREIKAKWKCNVSHKKCAFWFGLIGKFNRNGVVNCVLYSQEANRHGKQLIGSGNRK